MKKITLLLTMLISVFGFSQNLVTNGNFQTGVAAPWTGNAANAVDLGGGNWVNQAEVATAGNPWDVNLSQEIVLVSGKTYRFTFDAFTAASTGTRTLIAGLGQTAAPYAAVTSTVTLTSTPQTFTNDITITYGDAVTDRVIFDMGAATGFVFIDNVSVVEVLPLIQNFEAPVTYSTATGFEGATASVVVDPAVGSPNGQVFKGVQGPGGQPWQGIEFVQTTKSAKLTTNKTMSVDVYCSQAFNILAKVDQGGVGAPASANGQAYTTPGQWQTLTFNFAAPMDGTAVANGEYQKIIFFGNWNSTNNGFNNPVTSLTFYVDNIRAEEGIITPPSDPIPATPAPIPTALNANVYSIYNDTNNYTTVFPVQYQFGTLSGEPDLDSSTAINKAYKFNFGIAGWGQGEAMANITSYNYVSFDYWAQPGLPNGFKFVMISNNGSVVERSYQIGTNEALVTGQWKKVEIPLSYFTNLGFANTNFFQWKVSPFADSVTNAGFVYIDNILLTTTSVLSANTFTTSKVKLYPNPTSNVLNIESLGTIQTISVYNVLGQEVINKELNSTSTALDVSSLNSGIYVVKTNVDGVTSTTKFIKQ